MLLQNGYLLLSRSLRVIIHFAKTVWHAKIPSTSKNVPRAARFIPLEVSGRHLFREVGGAQFSHTLLKTSDFPRSEAIMLCQRSLPVSCGTINYNANLLELIEV